MFASLLVLLNVGAKVVKEPLPFGLMGTLTGPLSPDAIPLVSASLLAAWVINNSTDILPNHHLIPIVKNDDGNEGTNFFCTLEYSGVTARGPEHPANKVPMIVGPDYSSLAIVASRVTREFQLPMLSPVATAASLSNNDMFPFFARVVPSDAYQGKSLANIVWSFGWRTVGSIFASDAYSSGLANAFQQDCQLLGITVAITQSFTGNESVKQQVDQLRMSGVVVFLIVGLSPSAELVLNELNRQGMLVPPYVYLLTDAVTLSDSLAKLLTGALQTRVGYDQDTEEYKTYNAYMTWASNQTNEQYPDLSVRQIVPDSAFAYDSVFIAAKALSALQRMYKMCNVPAPSYPADVQTETEGPTPAPTYRNGNGNGNGSGVNWDGNNNDDSTPTERKEGPLIPVNNNDNNTNNDNDNNNDNNDNTTDPTPAPSAPDDSNGDYDAEDNAGELIAEDCENLRAGREGEVLMKLLRSVVYQGATGLIEFDPVTGDRKSTTYSVYNMQPGGWVQIGSATKAVFNRSASVQIMWADGTTRVPKDRLPLMRDDISDSVRVAFFFFETLVFVILALVIGVIGYYRRYREIRTTSPVFLLMLLFGCALQNTSAVLTTVESAPIQCVAAYWLALLGFTMVLVSLGLTMHKLNLLFQTPSQSGLHTRTVEPISDRLVWKVFLPLLLVDVILLLGWSLNFTRYGPYGEEKGFGYGWIPGTTQAETRPLGGGEWDGKEDPGTVMILSCTSADVTVSSVIFVYQLLCLLAVAGVLYVGRHIPSNFFGVASVAFSLYSLAIATVLWTVAHTFLHTFISVVIQVISILFLEVSIIGAMVIPRFMALYAEPLRGDPRAQAEREAVTVLQKEDMELLVANCLSKETKLQKVKMRVCEEQQRWAEERWRLEEELRYASEVPRSYFSLFQRPQLQCPTPQRLALSNESLTYLQGLKDSTDGHRRRRRRRQKGSFTSPASPALHTLWHPPPMTLGLSKDDLAVENTEEKDRDRDNDVFGRSRRLSTSSDLVVTSGGGNNNNTRSALHTHRLQNLKDADRLAAQQHHHNYNYNYNYNQNNNNNVNLFQQHSPPYPILQSTITAATLSTAHSSALGSVAGGDGDGLGVGMNDHHDSSSSSSSGSGSGSSSSSSSSSSSALQRHTTASDVEMHEFPGVQVVHGSFSSDCGVPLSPSESGGGGGGGGRGEGRSLPREPIFISPSHTHRSSSTNDLGAQCTAINVQLRERERRVMRDDERRSNEEHQHQQHEERENLNNVNPEIMNREEEEGGGRGGEEDEEEEEISSLISPVRIHTHPSHSSQPSHSSHPSHPSHPSTTEQKPDA